MLQWQALTANQASRLACAVLSKCVCKECILFCLTTKTSQGFHLHFVFSVNVKWSHSGLLLRAENNKAHLDATKHPQCFWDKETVLINEGTVRSSTSSVRVVERCYQTCTSYAFRCILHLQCLYTDSCGIRYNSLCCFFSRLGQGGARRGHATVPKPLWEGRSVCQVWCPVPRQQLDQPWETCGMTCYLLSIIFWNYLVDYSENTHLLYILKNVQWALLVKWQWTRHVQNKWLSYNMNLLVLYRNL